MVLVNGSVTRITDPRGEVCISHQSQEDEEALRRLKRQLEQAQRDLERAECEQNYEAVLRLRYRIIPHLEKQIQRLDQASCRAHSEETACARAVWPKNAVERSRRGNHLLFPVLPKGAGTARLEVRW